MMIDAVSKPSPKSSSSRPVLSSGAIASMTLLKEKYIYQYHGLRTVSARAVGEPCGWRAQGDVPADGADKVEVDNEAPCYSLLVERGGRMQQLELCTRNEQ